MGGQLKDDPEPAVLKDGPKAVLLEDGPKAGEETSSRSGRRLEPKWLRNSVNIYNGWS